MTVPSVIRATFADWRTVKTRKSLQLVFEVPLEQQGAVLTMLGAPMPDVEKWCAIALLDGKAEAKPERDDTVRRQAASEQAKARYREGTAAERARSRAGRLPKDFQFRDWVAERAGWIGGCTEGDAMRYIRDICCNGESRRLIAENAEYCRRFLEMETEYEMAIGVLAEQR